MIKHQPKTTVTAVAALLASLALVGCGRNDDVAETRVDTRTADSSAVIRSEPTAGEQAAEASRDAAQSTREAARDAAQATREAGRDAAQATGSALDKAGDQASDALITTSVNTELAKDPALSALKIDVDTENGRVVLNGTAPDEAAKQRAAELARSVEGVKDVDNQLTVGATKG